MRGGFIMKQTISPIALVRLALVIAAIVVAPVLLKYGNKDSDRSSNQVAPTSEGVEHGTGTEPGTDTRDATVEALAVEPFKPVERKPRLLKQLNPGYPEIARLMGLEGTVLVKVLVNEHGQPKRAIVIKSDSRVFDETARKAALESRFRPAVMNSNPVKCWVLIPYKFTLG
jgi:TonB family protein